MARKHSAREPRQKPGAALADKLARLGIARDADLVLHLPLRYEDHTRLVPLGFAPTRDRAAGGRNCRHDGHPVSAAPPARVPARGCRRRCRRPRAARPALLPLLSESAKSARSRPPRARVRRSARRSFRPRDRPSASSPSSTSAPPLPDRLTPVYPTTAGLAQEMLRKLIARALASDPALTAETLPEWLVQRRQLWKFGDALAFLHAPPPRLSSQAQKRARGAHASCVDATEIRRARRPAAVAQGASQSARGEARAGTDGHPRADRRSRARVPFKLTRAQERVWREISNDLKRATPMQRLLQGDVGSGKTIVAALAALQAIESGRQVASHGADRNPGRAALPQARAMARRTCRSRSRG